MVEKIGEFSLDVIETLHLGIPVGTAIYIGATNIAHMVSEHGYEYYRYFDKIPLILSSPDYVRLKKDDNSIEYVKSVGKHIKIAVRVAGDGNYYVRSLYYIETNRVENLLKKGELKPLTNK